MQSLMETPDTEVSIGARIHALLRREGKKPTWLAGQLGVRERTVERWEDGVHDPRSGQIAPIAELFGVSVAWVLLGREDPQVEKFIREGQEDGTPPEEIIDMMIGRGNTDALEAAEAAAAAEPTAEASEQPVAEVPSDEEIAEQLARRPDGPARTRGESRRDRRGTKRRRSSDEEEQS